MANKKISKVNLSGESYEIDVATNLKATNILSSNKGQTSKVATVGAVQKPDGVNALFDENNKISSSYLSDTILGQLKFGGSLSLMDEDENLSVNQGLTLSISPSAALNGTFQEYLKNLANFDNSWIVQYPGMKFKTQVSYEDPAYPNGQPEWSFWCPYGPEGSGPERDVKFPASICEGYYFIAGTDLPGSYYDPQRETLSHSYSEGYTVILAEAQVGDWQVVSNGKLIKIDNTDTITHIKDSYTSLLSIEGAGLKLNKITKNNKQQVVIEGEALVGDPSGKDESAIVNVGYLKKNTISELSDTDVKLSSELKTYYNVGKITDARGDHPITIGNEGDSLRDVFNNLFTMDEVQPTITSYPSVSCTLGSNESNERGTSIYSVSYSITFNDGKYTNADTTGVKMTDYEFSAGTASSTTTTTGTLTLPSTYVVGTTDTISFDLTANYSQGDIAKTNLGNNSDTGLRIPADSCEATPTFSKNAVDYPYFISSSAADVSALSGQSISKKTTSLTSDTGESCNYNANAYVWIFVRKGNTATQPSKTIQAYSDIAKAWGPFLGGTDPKGTITFNKANGVSDTFFAYRTKNTADEADSATFRLNND